MLDALIPHIPVVGCDGQGGFITPTHTTGLGAGPEVYNNMAASHNCVGGSEQGCIPKNPPVGNPALTGSSSTLPAPAHWYANGCGNGGMVAKEAAVPAFAPATAEVTVCVCAGVCQRKCVPY